MLILIFISYLIDPGLDSVYYRFVPIDTNIYEEIRLIEDGGEEISLSGTKSFSVSYGEQGLLIDQGMWINFSGNTGDLTIDGAIADQEGGGDITKSLFEVENTKIGFKAPWGGGQVGDLFLSHDLKQGAVRQQGIGGELGVGPIRGGLVVSKGYYRRKKIRPEEHQGPYVIDEHGIVSGSEHVYFNGIVIIKGLDYLIDYESGEITFNPTRPVHPTDRIEVDYLSSSVKFLKLSSYGEALYLKHRIGYFGDFEDPSQPIGFELDNERRDALESAGDNLVWVDGGDTLTDGDYIKVGDHYQFAGFGSGDYQVRFTYVGGDSGDYVYDQTIHAYLYTGSGGNYIAKIKIAPPTKERLIYTNSQLNLGPLDLNIEPALAICDQNVLSKRDDDDNVGIGFGGRIEYGSGPRAYLDIYEREEEFRYPIQTDYDLSYLWGVDSEVVMLNRYQAGFVTRHMGIDFNLGGGLLNRTWPKGFITTGFKNGHLAYSRFKRRFRFDGGYDLPIYFVIPGVGLLLEDDRRQSYLQVRVPDLLKLRYQVVKDTLGNGDGFDVLLSPAYGVVRGLLSWTRNRWEGEDWDLVSLSASSSYPITVSGSFNLNREVKRRYDEFYIEVDPGEGDYSLDTLTGRYIRDPGGSYIRKINYLDEYDMTSSYIYKLLSDFEYGSGEIVGNVDDDRTEFRSSGDLTFPINMLDMSFSGDYSRNKDRTFDEIDSDLDVESGIYFRLTQTWRIGPFGHYRKTKETESGTNIREELTRGGKIRVLMSGAMGLEGYLGYDLILAESPAYFPELGKIQINNPLFGIDFYVPFMGFRLFSCVDLSYIYSDQKLPGFLSILHPQGYNAVYRIGFDRKIGEKSTVGFSYSGRYHPEYKWDHNLNFSSRIRF